ncbi:MAG: hypothetical protein AB1941_27435 [Gemmatimonadota bacterium]
MTRLLRRLAGVALTVLLTACGDPSSRTTTTTLVRDSAGVAIVENPSETGDSLAWRIASRPALDVGGGATPSEQLFQALAATRLPDGRVVVANAGTHELRFYASDGRHLLTAGREGDGPGEFRHLGWVGLLSGDTLAAWDAVQGRLSVFDSRGRFVRGFTSTGLPGIFPQLHGAFADGSVVLATGMDLARLPAAGQVWRDTAAYVRVGHAGERLGDLGRFPGTEQFAALPPGGRGTFIVNTRPFARRTVTAVRGDRLYVGTGDRYEVAVYDASGRLARLVRKEHRPLAVTSKDREDYRASLVNLGSEQARRDEERMRESAPYPDAMPPYTGLRVDAEGYLWVEEAVRPGERGAGVPWSVFDPEGRFLGTLRLPPALHVLEIGRDYVLGRARDESDREHLRLYRLERPSAAPRT